MVRRQIEKFLRDSGMSATRFGREVARDPRLVHDLRRGREPGAGMVARITAYLDARS
jgi:2,4-dienoyl-CoA reductase-like NADH-dependent reductase (Old Yellow Enzyme family)